MEGVGGDGTSAAAPLNQWRHDVWKLFQFYLDKTTPHAVYRWIGTFVLASIYALRVYYVQGFYIVTYGLGIYILNLLIGFLSPLDDPELEPSDGPMLPTKGSDEFKPFIRRLPEFKFWFSNFRSQDYSAVRPRQLFEKVEVDKPAASRSTSAEIYIISLKYKAPAKIDPRLLDVVDVLRGTKQKIHRDG